MPPIKDKKYKPSLLKICVIMFVSMTLFVLVIVAVSGTLEEVRDASRERAARREEVSDVTTTPPPARAADVHNDSEDIVFTGISYPETGGLLELPINGATGWAAARTALREGPDTSHGQILSLTPGQGFTIIGESGNWWYVELPDTTSGWVDYRACFINLPDIIPSMIYLITNADSSFFRSSGYDIPDVTGRQMYVSHGYNPRLERDEYLVPCMYTLALSIFEAQQMALENSETIIAYEIFRPRSTQRAVVAGLTQLMEENGTVRENINTPPWHIGWFISQGISNHQRGAAIDASLGRVRETELRRTGDFVYTNVSSFTELAMPTDIHELSPWAAISNSPINISVSQILGESVTMRDSVTSGVVSMQYYFASAGLNPIASEWWHFDHAPSRSAAISMGISGDFYVDGNHSRPPVLVDSDE